MTNETSERLHLYPSEIEQMVKACKHTSFSNRDKAVVILLYHHGLRVSELIRLRWIDINFETASIFIRRAKGSNNGSHSINGEELRLLKSLFNKSVSNFVITNQKNPNLPITRQAIFQIIKKLGKLANLKIEVHPHMLRHSCGYHLASKGVPLREIQIYLGHKNVENTVHYTWMNPNTSRNYFE